MKKFIWLFLLVLVGCTNEKDPSEDSTSQEEDYSSNEVLQQVGFSIKENKLIISNHSDKMVTIINSDMDIYVKKEGKWQLFNETRAMIYLTTNILSQETIEEDLSVQTESIQAGEIKIIVHYIVDEKEFEKELIYEKQ